MIARTPTGKPAFSCHDFMLKHKQPGELLPRAEFDRLVKAREFAIGPFVETFGQGAGEPYNPHRQVWGKLCDGRCVFAELTA